MSEFENTSAMRDEFLNRRTAIVGVGMAAVGVSVAACGSGSTGDAGKSATASARPRTALVKAADVPVGGGVIVGDTVVTQPTAGDFRGFSSICTHQGCRVDRVSSGEIECPCHFSKFRLDGTVASGPARRPLDVKPVHVDGADIVSS